MTKSRLYIEMQSALREHEKDYLSFRQKVAGDYTKSQMSKAAAYTLFCHAEIEAYFENWSLHFVNLAQTKWRQGKATKPLVHMCTFHEGREPIKKVPTTDVWTEVVEKSFRKQFHVISSNHGIKEENVSALLAPLGFDIRKIDPVLLGDLSALGVLRGGHAHTARKSQLSAVFDPFDRRNKAISILSLLQHLDAELVAYKKQCF